jgi:hypothetical protein
MLAWFPSAEATIAPFKAITSIFFTSPETVIISVAGLGVISISISEAIVATLSPIQFAPIRMLST